MTAAPSRLPLLAAVAALAACAGSSSPDTAQDPTLFRVKRDDLPITVRENAELQALRETIVRSEVEGQATIIYIIPEGSQVKQGDKLVEIDVSELVEKRANQAISVAKADAALKQATKEKEILQKELTTKHKTAESNLEIARMEVEKLLGRPKGSQSGAGSNSDMLLRLQALVQPAAEPAPAAAPNGDHGSAPPRSSQVAQVDPRSFARLVDKVRAVLEQEAAVDRDMGEMANRILQQADQIRLSMADLKVKEDTFGHSERLAAKNFITRNELEKDKLAFESQMSKVRLAWNDLDLLINYTLGKELLKLSRDRDNAALELERVVASNEASVTKADSDLASREAEFTLAKERLENLDRQIKSAVITAPTPGTVVYARIDRNRGGGEAVREGVQVRERQELIILPDTTKMRCLVKVQEAQVDKVARGQPAFVVVEAFQGETFTGRVTSVAPVADSNSGWMTSDRKVYTTIVELDSDNPDGRLRSRMAANVTIMVDTIQGTLPVPLQAVFRDRSVNYVWKQTAGGPVPVPVQVGRQNTERVEVLQGTAEGDLLHLTMPAGVQAPKLEQPVAPTPAPLREGERPAAAAGNGPGAPGAEDGQRRRGPGQGGMAAMNKKLAEMTPEELEDYKGRLDRTQMLIDGVRDRGSEQVAKEMEEAYGSLKKALEANDLETAQTHQDKLRALLRSAMPNRGQGGEGGDRPRRGDGGGGPGGGGRPGRGN
ncbi:MAG: HlyD family efflux transporter periplasmic adaptor subunit [Planctomycetes bacterium]|nr:HlyD family efflux transporter periplasmic adaptor subunit [Planctomycetota bacterium]